MESQHMTQQVFADSIGLAPATLSSIFTGRTNPSLNVVGAIKKKIPNISTDWLVFGTGEMYEGPTAPSDSQFSATDQGVNGAPNVQNPMLDFDQSPSPTPQQVGQTPYSFNSVKSTRPEIERTEVKIIDKPQRKVKEIRVFYDDQTWETFVPEKK